MDSQLDYVALIRMRRSTRSYRRHVLTEADREDVAAGISSAVPFNDSIRLDWRLAERSVMGSSALLYAQCGTSEDELVEYGYRGQQIVLALLARDWGTCWYGFSRLPGSPCSIAVGRPATPGFLSALAGALSRGHTRKSVEQLVPKGIPAGSPRHLLTVLESARLAPSAMNRQAWTFEVFSDTEIIIHSDTGRFLDLGICLANAAASARQLAGEAVVRRLDSGRYAVSW